MSKSQKDDSISSLVIASSAAFVISIIPTVLFSLLSGTVGGPGLSNEEPKFTDHIPLIGLVIGLLLLSLGGMRTIPPLWMLLASPIAFASFVLGLMLS